MFWSRKAKTRKYSGRPLSPAKINSQQETNDHVRRERQKNIEHYAVIVSIIGAMVAIPVLYLLLLLVNRHSPSQETTYLWSGLTASVGYVFGKKTGGQK